MVTVSFADVAFAGMFAMGIIIKVAGLRAWVHVYLIWANWVLACWFWDSAMPLTAVMLIVSAALAAIYVYRGFSA